MWYQFHINDGVAQDLLSWLSVLLSNIFKVELVRISVGATLSETRKSIHSENKKLQNALADCIYDNLSAKQQRLLLANFRTCTYTCMLLQCANLLTCVLVPLQNNDWK